jgi:hypothetical protein
LGVFWPFRYPGPMRNTRVDPQGAPAIFRRLRDLSLLAESEGPCGGTGRRARLKIEFRKECWFDSGQGHQPTLLRSFGSQATLKRP